MIRRPADARSGGGGTPAARREVPSDAFAVPMVLAFIVALGLLGAGAVWLAVGGLRSAGLYTAHERAARTAEAALDRAVATFADSGAAPRAWPLTGSVGGHAFRATIARDSFDFGHGPRPVWIDAAAGDVRNGDGRGDPVYVIRASASRGSYRSTRLLWVSRHSTFDLPAAFSVNARGMSRWRGPWTISGTNVDAAGAPVDPADAAVTGACSENRPAIQLTHPTANPIAQGISLSGNPAYAGEIPPYVRRDGVEPWSSAEEVLGVEEGALDAAQRSGLQHDAQRPDTLSGLTWITDRAGAVGACLTRTGCANIQGSGVLLVHNPRYDPREHDPTDPRYDPTVVLDPGRAPARLVNLSGGTFHGLVVVDEAPDRPGGPVTIHGAVVVLSSASGARREWDGSAVRYSCDALSRAARALGLPPRRLAWSASP